MYRCIPKGHNSYWTCLCGILLLSPYIIPILAPSNASHRTLRKCFPAVCNMCNMDYFRRWRYIYKYEAHAPKISRILLYCIQIVWKHRSWINQFYSLSVFGKVFWLCSLYLFMEELKNLCHITTRNSRTCSVCKCSSASSLSSQTQPTKTELNENKIDIRLRILHGGRHLLLWRSNTQITTSPYAHRIKLHVK